jgi:hypothetical protein
MNLQKHIWEGWTVQSFFIDELECKFNLLCMDKVLLISLLVKKGT